jgi:hypothetical protein
MDQFGYLKGVPVDQFVLVSYYLSTATDNSESHILLSYGNLECPLRNQRWSKGGNVADQNTIIEFKTNSISPAQLIACVQQLKSSILTRFFKASQQDIWCQRKDSTVDRLRISERLEPKQI